MMLTKKSVVVIYPRRLDPDCYKVVIDILSSLIHSVARVSTEESRPQTVTNETQCKNDALSLGAK